MKRILPLFFVLLLFNSCSVKEYTPTIPAVFDEKAAVSVGDFTFECEICRNESLFTLICLDTNAKGLEMSYDGSNLNFSYDDLEYGLEAVNFEKTNPVIIIYDIFAALENGSAQAQKTQEGFKYTGTVSAGDFVLHQAEDNSLELIEIPSLSFSVSFH